MKRAVAGLVAGAALLAGCGEDGDGASGPGPADPDGGVSADTTSASADAADGRLPQGDEAVGPDPGELTVDVTNPWFPLAPGTRWVYREQTEDGAVVQVVVTVTSATKQVASGGEARVVRDTVRLDGEIVEDTLDWFAQDAAGNVWYLGEDTAEFEDGRMTTREGSFEAGVDGALPGVIMPAEPVVGLAYRQEFYDGVAEDNGEVLALEERATVPADEYDGLLQTADTTALEPDVIEHKYYARDVGLVLTVDVGEGGREELLTVSTVPAAEARRAGHAPLGEAY